MPRRSFLALLVFTATLAVCAVSITRYRQLGYMRALADRWLVLGLNVAEHGVLGQRDEPSMFKPPGYPAFLGALLVATTGRPRGTGVPAHFPRSSELIGLDPPYELAYLERAARSVYWSHAALLAAAAALLFWWLSESLRAGVALAAALVFGLNPYSVTLAGILYYSVLHLFTLVVGCYVLHRALGREDGPSWPWLLAGAAWGLATLVRPMTLLLPPFVLLALLLRTRGHWGRSLRRTFLFAAGLALCIAPWTARNYRLSGRVVPVSAQAWSSLWAATAEPVPVEPNHYRWKELRERWMVILKRVPGEHLRSDPNSVADNLALESELRDVSLRNLRRRPGVYVGNVARAFATFNLHINSVQVQVFQRVQAPGRPLSDWYWPGDPQKFYAPHARRAFAALVAALTLAGLGGALLALRERDTTVLAAGAVYLCLLTAHSLTWMDMMYYYAKLPLLVVFAFVFVDRACGWRALRIGGRAVSVGALLGGVFLVWALSLTVWVFQA